MKRECFDIGTIQAFIDGEVGGEAGAAIAEHAAACDECAGRIAAAEEETALVFSVLDGEVNTLVPTQRLWSRINDSLSVERKPTFGEKLSAAFAWVFAQPALAVTFGVVIMLAFGAFYFISRGISMDAPTPEFAATHSQVTSAAPKAGETAVVPVADVAEAPAGTSGGDIIAEPLNESRPDVRIETANYRHSPRRTPARSSKNSEVREPKAVPAVYLPGEESYVRTIAGLKQNIDENKDMVMPAATRFSYERDMAVVDDTIGKLRSAVAKDPANEAAKRALYASYQDKIDLLNSVQQREELIASLQ